MARCLYVRPAHIVFSLALRCWASRSPAPRSVGHVQAPATFAARIAQLSERAGFFDTDNLISNEKSYLHVIPALRAANLGGGAYIGVGPDQNFSYIAQVKPSIAFIVDLRRDNLLLHLLFKALFSLSETRVDYLSLLFGRAVPARLDDWRRADLDKIVTYIEESQPTEAGHGGAQGSRRRGRFARSASRSRPRISRQSTDSTGDSSAPVCLSNSKRSDARRNATIRPIATCSSKPIAKANAGAFWPMKTASK